MPNPRRKKSALILTTLLVLSTIALSASTNAQETTGRTTGIEDLTVSLTSGTKHIERDSSFTLTVLATNLDMSSEYTLELSFCEPQYESNWNPTTQTQEYTHYCYDIIEDRADISVGIDFTPTLSTDSITITIDDPGLHADSYDSATNEYVESGLYNETYVLYAELTIQGAPVTSNSTNAFVLGGEVDEWNIDGLSNVLIGSSLNIFGHVYMTSTDRNVDQYQVDCGIYAVGSSVASTTASTTQWIQYWSGHYFEISIPSPTTAGTHFVMCDLIRNSDSASMGTMTSENIEVIDDTSNQDDATISVSVDMHPTEAWGTVVIDAIDLDAGQEYTLNWIVENYSLTTPATMMQNDHVWVAGNDGIHSYSLEFHDLADTTDACITVVFTAGETELQTVSNVCWASASTADGDDDGVLDKNDVCPETTAGLTVQADGCSDPDSDGWDTDLEIDCNTDPNDPNDMPTDIDNDGTCDYLDTDKDGDGYLDVDEIVAGTDPLDPNSKPGNRLPTCAVYYSLEVDGAPTTFEGDAVIPALSGVSAQAAASTLVPTTITIPAGSYYITAHCIDLDGDDITVTVNDITIGPIAGEVSAGAIIEIGEDVEETVDVQITWTDGQDTLTALVTVELDGDGGWIPGFGASLAIMALIGAGIIISRRNE